MGGKSDKEIVEDREIVGDGELRNGSELRVRGGRSLHRGRRERERERARCRLKKRLIELLKSLLD